jgi:thiol-disulfide isomerase/thioredoxin
MKLIAALFLLLLQYGYTYSQNSVTAVLDNVSQALNSYKNIRYTGTRELNYPSENYHYNSKWIVYYDFQSTDTITGFKFQVEDSVSKQVFNGTEKFDLDKKAKTVKIKERLNKKSFTSLSAFYNSIITLKNVLPLIGNDPSATKAIADTTINNITYDMLTINIGKRRIQNLGNGFDSMTTKSNFIYKIIIRKDNHLPVEVVQMNDLNNDYIKTRFTNIETNSKAPAESSWHYATFTSEYKRKAISPAKGDLAPTWKLDVYNTGNSLSLADLKGQVILLDFWIKNCGPCIQSVPHLNELQEKFRDRNFKIISINVADTREDITWFCNKHNSQYTVLLNGKEVAEKYAIKGFPTFYIIDKEGKIIHFVEGFDKSSHAAIEQVIEKAL